MYDVAIIESWTGRARADREGLRLQRHRMKRYVERHHEIRGGDDSPNRPRVLGFYLRASKQPPSAWFASWPRVA